MKEQGGNRNRNLWDLAAAVLAVLLLLAFAVFCFAWLFFGLTEAAAAVFACGVLLLLGLLFRLPARSRVTAKLWRRLFMAGLAANGLAVAAFAAVLILLAAAL